MIYVVIYDDRTTIKKFSFQNGTSLDLFPDVQEILYAYRQTSSNAPEAGGMILGYENAGTGIFTVSGATEPQASDMRWRFALFFGKGHREMLKKLKPPYGYIGTWHTHPSGTPIPSSVDLRDWKKCIKQNKNSTSTLVFIIAGTESYRIWLYDSNSDSFMEGRLT